MMQACVKVIHQHPLPNNLQTSLPSNFFWGRGPRDLLYVRTPELALVLNFQKQDH